MEQHSSNSAQWFLDQRLLHHSENKRSLELFQLDKTSHQSEKIHAAIPWAILPSYKHGT